MITVHLIFNAHLDPIWLWPWQAGLDSAIATCRSACDRLDAHGDIFLTRGEAWIYDQIERVDPQLFARIRKHIEAGRWEIVGGWWIQPDCNLPSGFGMQRQIEMGKRYFLDHFGKFPRTAYNVDSFGHAATLPTLMRAAGQDRYVMMRPMPNEMQLPARIFRWREAAGRPEVVTFRIAEHYNVSQPTPELIRAAASDLPAGITHTMCFLGVGDHGGGPTEQLIAWSRQNQNAFPGLRLQFSTVERFFDAIAGQTQSLPLVTGELQYHAVGCYSVYRPVKLAVRKAEHLLRQAEVALEHDPKAPTDSAKRLDDAWRQVCFNHFHDTLGGTCLPSAYAQVEAQLGMSCALADEAIHLSVRRQMNALPDDPMQRLVLFNASDAPFQEYVEVEPWLEWQRWQPHWQLRDEGGQLVPAQLLQTEASTNGMTRLLLPIQAAAGKLRALRIDRSASGVADVAQKATAADDAIANGEGIAVRLGSRAGMSLGRHALGLPQFQLLQDPSDTWSHGQDRYPAGPVITPAWEAPFVVDAGPLMASVIQVGRIGQSQLIAEYRVYANQPYVELRARIHWAEPRCLLKLVLPLPAAGVRRFDGILGGEIERPMTGAELPLRDRSLIELADGARLGIVCPEVFALDANPARVRLTLLRSPLMAHHTPHPGFAARSRVSDQGVHEFRIRFSCGEQVTGEGLDLQALAMQRPPIFADLTRGMPAEARA